MKIRKLEKKEYGEASSLIQNVIKAERKGSWSEEGAAGVLSFLNERINDFPSLGIFDPDMKGVLVYEDEPCHILFLAVKHVEQRKGYGRALLQYFLQKADEKNFTRATVNAADSAAGFYRHLGFEDTETLTEAEGLRYQPMEYLLGRHWLGKQVNVIVDHPLGSGHPFIPDEEYQLNAGYIPNASDADGEMLEAYVIGVDEPLESFKGYVVAMLYRKNGSAHAIVGPAGLHVTKKEIINSVAFQEQYYETRLLMA